MPPNRRVQLPGADLSQVWDSVVRLDSPHLMNVASTISRFVGPPPPPPLVPVIGNWEDRKGKLRLRYEYPPVILTQDGQMEPEL